MEINTCLVIETGVKLQQSGFRQKHLQESFYPGRKVLDMDICKRVVIWDEQFSLFFFLLDFWTFSLAFGLFGFNIFILFLKFIHL